MPAPSRYRTLALILPVILGLSTGGCGRMGDRPKEESADAQPTDIAFRNIGADVAYVGDAACASCHEDEYHRYETHGMAETTSRLTPDIAIASYPSPVLYHEKTNLWYRAFESNGRYFQQEFRLDANGDTTHSLTREMMYVVGSGTIAHTYLTVEDDFYTEMPLTWYTQRGRWDFSPGYEILNNRFNRAIPDRCVACHNAYPETVENVPGMFKEIGNGITCERCHGPGDLHVNERLENPEPASDIDPTIVNPKYLSLDIRMDVCQQCHVTATVSILRDGREPFEFVPTEALQSHVALFSEVEADGKTIAVTSHARRLRKSACFVALVQSETPMECVTCHDPHQSFRDQGPDHFNAICQDCHDQASLAARVSPERLPDHQQDGDCTTCHMPKTAVFGVPHSAFTDHWIRVVGRSEADKAETIEGARAGSLIPYFSVDRDSPDAPVYEGVAYIVLGDRNNDTRATERGVQMLESALTDDSRFGDAHYQLGLSLFTLGRLQEATAPLEAAVRLGPDIPERLNALAQLYERIGRAPDKIAGLYRHALQIQPLAAPIRVNYGRFLETQGRPAEARKQYETVITQRPSLATAHYNLGTIMLQDGDFENGESELREAIHLDPDYSEAYGNLGVLLATQNRKLEARKMFERGVDADPESAVALNNLASFYLNEGLDAEALPLLKKAVELQPAYVDALANLALASLRAGDDQGAGSYARKALAIDPGNALANQIVQAVN